MVFLVFPVVGFCCGVLIVTSVSMFVIVCVGVFSVFLLWGFWFSSSLIVISFFFLVVGGIMCVFAYVSSFSYSYMVSVSPLFLSFFILFSPVMFVFFLDWNFSFILSKIYDSWVLSSVLSVLSILVLVLVVISMSSFLFSSYGSVRPSTI